MTARARVAITERRGVPFRVYVFEAVHELRSGLRTSMVPLMFAGLVGYVFMMLMNARYLRDMGAADVPRNSSLIVYQMTSGQAFWLIFVWAWVFAQVVSRDQGARLQEVVFATPVSLRGLLLARYAGALVLACILGSSSSVALMLVPALGTLGLVPASAIGPTPFLAIFHAWGLFVLPSALGLGAIYVVAALRTRSASGPFVASAVILLAWMGAMVVLRSADLHNTTATLIDVSGFGEAEHQTKLWTPSEKANALMQLTPPLLLNRVLWTAVPLGVLGFSIARLRRETLVLERTAADRPMDEGEFRSAPAPGLAPIAVSSWLRATWCETRFLLSRAVSRWAFVVAIVLWTCLNALAPFVHMLGHPEGPLVPRGQILAPFLLDFCYLFSVFGVAGFVGTLVRRDQQPGFAEMLDATPAPLGVRVLSTVLAAAAITLAFALAPTLSAWLAMGLLVPQSFDVATPLVVNAFVAAPALLELCGVTLLIHTLVRSAGTAHALAMFAAFVAVVNHEVGIVSYPPAQFGIPAHVELSELGGVRPWVASLAALDAYKVALFALLSSLAWLAYTRGTALTLSDRLRAACRRIRGGAGVLAAGASIALLATGALLFDRLVTRGGYRSDAEREREDAEWERKYWGRAGAFSIAGGEVEATIDPARSRAHTVVRLRGVRSDNGWLRGELPDATRALSAEVGGRARPVSTEFDDFELELGACRPSGCDVTLELDIVADGFGLQDVPPWLHSSGVWARAADLVPRFGLDLERRLRSPIVRTAHALNVENASIAGRALVPAYGVAPLGDFSWRIRFTESGLGTELASKAREPLDFAVAWLPHDTGAVSSSFGALTVWHGPTRHEAARDVAEDVRVMRDCIQARTGLLLDVNTVLQAPRGLGDVSTHGRVLWLPEHHGWDVAPDGVGRIKRRAAIAQSLASKALAAAADLRVEPGSRFLTEGAAGAMGLACARSASQRELWLAWMARRSDHVVEALGALDAPLVGLASDGSARWVEEYAALAALSWTESHSAEQVKAALESLVDEVRAGAPLAAALARVVGPEMAGRLLGGPEASDIEVTEIAERVIVRAQRSRWAGGGWHAAPPPLSVTQYFDDGSTQVERLPLELDQQRTLIVFDAEPSFERSPLDNTWPRR